MSIAEGIAALLQFYSFIIEIAGEGEFGRFGSETLIVAALSTVCIENSVPGLTKMHLRSCIDHPKRLPALSRLLIPLSSSRRINRQN